MQKNESLQASIRGAKVSDGDWVEFKTIAFELRDSAATAKWLGERKLGPTSPIAKLAWALCYEVEQVQAQRKGTPEYWRDVGRCEIANYKKECQALEGLIVWADCLNDSRESLAQMEQLGQTIRMHMDYQRNTADAKKLRLDWVGALIEKSAQVGASEAVGALKSAFVEVAGEKELAVLVSQSLLTRMGELEKSLPTLSQYEELGRALRLSRGMGELPKTVWTKWGEVAEALIASATQLSQADSLRSHLEGSMIFMPSALQKSVGKPLIRALAQREAALMVGR